MSPRCRYCKGQGRGHFPDEDGNESGQFVVCQVCGGTGREGDSQGSSYILQAPDQPPTWSPSFSYARIASPTTHDQEGHNMTNSTTRESADR